MKKKIILAVLLPVFSAWAGDLTTDNLTVTKDATILGSMYFASTVSGTNGGGTATGGTITTNGNYRIHTFTNVGTANFVVSGGSLTCDVLVVAGGGATWRVGSHLGGGGGAGGLLYTNAMSVSGTQTITVGVGGVPNSGNNGGDSVFGPITAVGGGKGGGSDAPDGEDGGSGGGMYADYGDHAGAGINGQGHNAGGYPNSKGGAGGGAGTEGIGTSDGDGSVRGGAGLEFPQFASVGGSPAGWFAGGGGAGGSMGGAGGGGNGEFPVWSEVYTGGTDNTGGGAGGVWGTGDGKSGGSGIVIVRYPITTSSNITSLSISSNGISQISTSGVNVLMGKVGIGTNNPVEQLHVVGNARVDGTNIVSAITLGGETRATWPTGNLSASNNLSDITNKAAARANLGLGSAATNEAGAFLSPNGDGSQITGITAAQVGALSTNAGALIAANNLSDVANQATARANLGLGTAATNEASAFLSTTGGVVNGSLDIQYIPPKGDFVMGSYTNQ